MPRPKTKSELLALSEENFDKLFAFIEGMDNAEQEREFPKGTMNRNIRDVLMHLHHWHLMMAEWYKVGMADGKPDMPAKGYTWKTTPELNRKIWEESQSADLKTAKTAVKKSYQTIQALIEKHSSEELFEKKRYNWTGSTSLGSYLVSSTSSHYDWALKLIKKAFK